MIVLVSKSYLILVYIYYLTTLYPAIILYLLSMVYILLIYIFF